VRDGRAQGKTADSFTVFHLGSAHETRATEDEIWQSIAYAMFPVAAEAGNFAKVIVSTELATTKVPRRFFTLAKALSQASQLNMNSLR
jgi:hypothetical protein